ncbi:hypothetical protein GUITHDRAFT_66986, partial [Guillardia theta CCMP2712]
KTLLDQKSLRWIFVGGKGGVGKTTSSSSLAILLARVRRSVLVISTDPAHNLSDAFDQKLTKTPTLINGFDNLYAMEIDPSFEAAEDVLGMGAQSSGLLSSLSTSIPGIDEAISFGELLRQVHSLEYDCIVFDTAPTGHTLRLLSFPTLMEKALSKLVTMKAQFGGMFAAMQGMMGASMGSDEDMFSRLESMKQLIEEVNVQFKDPEKTTFVCVCIAEFLSLYETERLVQELAKQGMDTRVIIVNQLREEEEREEGKVCKSRVGIMTLEQIAELYEDFHVVKMPLLEHEVRGVTALGEYGKRLLDPHHFEV